MPDSQPKLASAAFLMAEPARAAMLLALAGGRALPAGELAFAGGVTAQTASSHLAKLLDGGLVAVETQGRHRYYRLASPEVALALESLASIPAANPPRHRLPSHREQSLQFARCCYDHLAGQLGVALTEALERNAMIVGTTDKKYRLTPAGSAWFTRMGLDLTRVKPTRNGIARQCLDWTERKHHLAGPLGIQLLELLCAKRWLRRDNASRAIHVTPAGWIGLRQELGVLPMAPKNDVA